ncbi:aminoacyl-tRNA hydrolase [Candidatus Saccharibacteria bacterium]|nr:aminoacyl-tRNA hydrolase [Candidatus Saccharibacteria bacterium]
MGLFDRKKENYSDSIPLYTLGNSQNLLVVGLGNIGAKYAKTRHNAGFMALDRYKDSHEFSNWIEKKDLKCLIATGNVGSTRVILVKPTTMMNISGEAVGAVQRFYKIQNADTVVVYDELDIDFGTIRARIGGSSGGHNGVKSLISIIGDQPDGGFGRIRIGIGPKPSTGGQSKIDSADFVLQNFSDDEQVILPKIIKEVCALIDERTTGPLQEATIKI